MEFLWYSLAGALGGVLGGMGMGGGTLLIPLLSIFYATEQKTAQAVNLIAFIPMAIIAIIIHAKNGYIEKKGLLPIIIPALITAVGAGFLSAILDGELLKKIFGGFLLVLSVIQFFSDKLAKFVEKKKNKNNFGNINKL